MSNFPLYDRLSKDLPKKDLSVKQKEEFINKLGTIDDNGKDLVYALIQFHNIIHEDESLSTSKKLPYKGGIQETSDTRKNLSWSLSDLPIKLRRILYKFVVMHTKNMEEERVNRNIE